VRAVNDALKASIAAGQTQIADLAAQVQAVTGERDAARTEVATLTKRATKAEAELDSEKTAHAKAQQDLATANRVLEHPAFKAAQAKTASVSAPDGGDAADVRAFGSKEAALTAYNKLSDPKAKAAFRAQHKDILGL